MDKLTPGQLRDLADQLWPNEQRVESNDLCFAAHGMRNEAARREGEQKRQEQERKCKRPDACMACDTECEPFESEGLGSAAGTYGDGPYMPQADIGPDNVIEAQAPQTDDLAKHLRDVPRNIAPRTLMLGAADRIEAQAREIAKARVHISNLCELLGSNPDAEMIRNVREEKAKAERDALKARVFRYDTGGGYMRSMTADHVEAEFARLQARVARLEDALEIAGAALSNRHAVRVVQDALAGDKT